MKIVYVVIMIAVLLAAPASADDNLYSPNPAPLLHDVLESTEEVRVCDVCGATRIKETWKYKIQFQSDEKPGFTVYIDGTTTGDNFKVCPVCAKKMLLVLVNIVNSEDYLEENGYAPVGALEKQTPFLRPATLTVNSAKVRFHPLKPIIKKCKECGREIEVKE